MNLFACMKNYTAMIYAKNNMLWKESMYGKAGKQDIVIDATSVQLHSILFYIFIITLLFVYCAKCPFLQ